MQEADIEGVAQAVSVRQHARETIKAALLKGWQVHVLSVNWSAALIRSVLAGIPSRIDREGADSLTLDAGDQQAVVIHANNLEMQLGISTGSLFVVLSREWMSELRCNHLVHHACMCTLCILMKRIRAALSVQKRNAVLCALVWLPR